MTCSTFSPQSKPRHRSGVRFSGPLGKKLAFALSLLLKSMLRFQHWYQTTAKVADCEGIALADLKRKSGHFQETMESALALIRTADPRRFQRVKEHIKWIINCTLEQAGAEYHKEFKSVRIDFEEPEEESDRDFKAGFWARSLVHEATHGHLFRYGIAYTDELRGRIERLCVKEENRFICRLASAHPDLARQLHREFNDQEWQFAWSATPKEKIRSLFRRTLKS
jgi:hypothetical protein